tara:strand:+ start:407 stop:1432 length:1026 start_codon:yes stop_codon:yes gene_type:complete
MDKKDLFKLLDTVQENGEETPIEGERILLIDSLNLFFRNFTTLGSVNTQGAHIGGLGGFFRSLGAMIRLMEPTKVYVVWDGRGSSNNRKNIIPEYKSERNVSRVTNWDTFDSHDDEDDSKIDQLTRIVQYLKTLPVKTVSIDKVEADDIIAYLSDVLPTHKDDKIFILSSDQDYLQLVNDKVTVYSPIVKKFFTPIQVTEKYGVHPDNFILYKTLMGDNSDRVPGIKGLGPKKLYKLFPELQQKVLTLDDIIEIATVRLKENIIYARLLSDLNGLRNRYKIMDLANPMIDENDKKFLDAFAAEPTPDYYPKIFKEMYNEDHLDNMIRNVDLWLKERFENLK